MTCQAWLVYEIVCECGFTATDQTAPDECPECGEPCDTTDSLG